MNSIRGAVNALRQAAADEAICNAPAFEMGLMGEHQRRKQTERELVHNYTDVLQRLVASDGIEDHWRIISAAAKENNPALSGLDAQTFVLTVLRKLSGVRRYDKLATVYPEYKKNFNAHLRRFKKDLICKVEGASSAHELRALLVGAAEQLGGLPDIYLAGRGGKRHAGKNRYIPKFIRDLAEYILELTGEMLAREALEVAVTAFADTVFYEEGIGVEEVRKAMRSTKRAGRSRKKT